MKRSTLPRRKWLEIVRNDRVRYMTELSRYQFQWRALNLIDARPLGGVEKKGADRGIDGRITFTVGPKGEMGQALVSVKSGHVNSSMIRDLKPSSKTPEEQRMIDILSRCVGELMGTN
jgi:hypothetical protein